MAWLPAVGFLMYVGMTLVQVAWWALVFRSFRTGKTDGANRKTPGVTLLLCARNEADNLQKNLPHLLAQQYTGPFEIILVDDASTDATPAVLADFQRRHPRLLRVITLSEKKIPGKKYALTEGLAAARFEWLLLTDADCRPAGSHWVATMARHFSESNDFVLGYGPYAAGPGLLNRWVRFETVFTAQHYLTLAQAGMPYMGVGRNLAWRKSIFEQLGGFAGHLDLAGGDDDLLVNAGAQHGRVAVCFEPEAFMFSEAPKTWRAWRRQKRRHLSAGGRYRLVHRLALGGLALSQVLHYFLLVLLVLSGVAAGWVVALYCLRLVMLGLAWRAFLRVSREGGLGLWLPLLDAAMAIYYAGFVGFALAFAAPKRW